MAHIRDTASDISPLNRTAVPCIVGSVGSLDKDGVGRAVISGNSDSFVQKPTEVFDTDSLAATWKSMFKRRQNSF
jgi:hypothetical protein